MQLHAQKTRFAGSAILWMALSLSVALHLLILPFFGERHTARSTNNFVTLGKAPSQKPEDFRKSRHNRRTTTKTGSSVKTGTIKAKPRLSGKKRKIYKDHVDIPFPIHESIHDTDQIVRLLSKLQTSNLFPTLGKQPVKSTRTPPRGARPQRTSGEYRSALKGETVSKSLRVVLGKAHGNLQKPVLHFPEFERAAYFESTMQKPKTHQVQQFIEYFGTYHPNLGDLAVSFRELYFKNLRRVTTERTGNEAAALLDYLTQAHDKEIILRESLLQIKKNPGTKLSIEAHFILENIYRIQRNGFYHLFEFLRNEEVYFRQLGKEAGYMMKKIVDHYVAQARRFGIATFRDAVRLYDQNRLAILDDALATTPNDYRRRDLLFLRGGILLGEDYGNDVTAGNVRDIKHALSTWEYAKVAKSTGDNLMVGYLLQIESAMASCGMDVDSCGRLRQQLRLIEQKDMATLAGRTARYPRR